MKRDHDALLMRSRRFKSSPWSALAALVCALFAGCTGMVYGRAGVRSDDGVPFAEIAITPQPEVQLALTKPLLVEGPVYPGVFYRYQVEESAVLVLGMRAGLGTGYLVFGYETLDGAGVRLLDNFKGNSYAEAYITLRW